MSFWGSQRTGAELNTKNYYAESCRLDLTLLLSGVPFSLDLVARKCQGKDIRLRPLRRDKLSRKDPKPRSAQLDPPSAPVLSEWSKRRCIGTAPSH